MAAHYGPIMGLLSAYMVVYQKTFVAAYCKVIMVAYYRVITVAHYGPFTAAYDIDGLTLPTVEASACCSYTQCCNVQLGIR